MCLPAAIAAAGLTGAQATTLALSAVGTAVSAVGAYNQASVQRQVANNNAQVAEWQAQDAQRRGETEAAAVQRRAAAFKSSQRVSLASKGLDLNSGTAADLQDETDFFGQIDTDTTRNNARKEAWALRAQRANFQAEAAASRPWMAAGGTLLSGAGQVADRWNSYRNPTVR
jgi:hypothetical protein